jgi:hypothetical protein
LASGQPQIKGTKTMLKTIIAALIIASGATAIVSKAYAGPTGEPTPYYMERASQNHDGGVGGGN